MHYDNQDSSVWDHPGKSGKGRQTGPDTSGHQKCLFLESLRFQEQWKELQNQIKSSQILGLLESERFQKQWKSLQQHWEILTNLIASGI